MIRIFVVTLILALSLSAQASENKMVACIDDHPPYQYLADEPYGSHISALKILAKLLEKELSYIQSPNFARCVALLKAGHVDVIAGLNETEKRKKFAFYAPFKLADKLTVITKKDITINDYSDFQGKIIGVPRGSTYFAKFDNDTSLKKVSIQNQRIGLSLLVTERIDLMMANSYMLNLHLPDIQKSELKISTMNFDEERAKETYFGFSKKNELGLTEEQVVKLVKQGFERGDFLPATNP